MAKILNIITSENPNLRIKSGVISSEFLKSDAFRSLVADMKLTMQKKDGVGLAAPQIGKNIRLIVVNTKNGPVSIINPIITKKSIRKEWGEEGCLSVPDKFGEVRRYKKIRCNYLDENLKNNTIEAEGLMARIIQHEIDHLDGILFIDKARNIKNIDKQKNN